jgi:mRNA interferase YafQ
MYKIIPSNQFKKDLKLAKKRGLDLKLLKTVVDTLAKGETLDVRYRDHRLTGNYRNFRECHIEPNWLLVYRVDDDELKLFLFRTGTHADLF